MCFEFIGNERSRLDPQRLGRLCAEPRHHRSISRCRQRTRWRCVVGRRRRGPGTAVGSPRGASTRGRTVWRRSPGRHRQRPGQRTAARLARTAAPTRWPGCAGWAAVARTSAGRPRDECAAWTAATSRSGCSAAFVAGRAASPGRPCGPAVAPGCPRRSPAGWGFSAAGLVEPRGTPVVAAWQRDGPLVWGRPVDRPGSVSGTPWRSGLRVEPGSVASRCERPPVACTWLELAACGWPLGAGHCWLGSFYKKKKEKL